MGMYTEINIALEVRSEDKKVIDILKLMSGGYIGIDDWDLPVHSLFSTDRWRFMLLGGSYYFTGKPHCSFEYDDIAKSYFFNCKE